MINELRSIPLGTAVIIFSLLAVSFIPKARTFFFYRLPLCIDEVFMRLDGRFNGYKTLKHVGAFDSEGHSRSLSLVVAAVLLFTLFGPTLSPVFGWISEEHFKSWIWGFSTLALFFVLLTILGYLSQLQLFKGQNLRWLHVFVIFVAAIYAIFVIPPEHIESSGLPYRHSVAWVSALFVALGPLIAVLQRLYFHDIRRRPSGGYFTKEEKALARRLLETTDVRKLVVGTERQVDSALGNVTWPRVFHALLMVPLREPILLLLIPAIAVIVPRPTWWFHFHTYTVAISWLSLSWLLLANGLYLHRWSMMITLMHRRFSRGGSLIISLLVIAVGFCDVLNVSYVRTITDSDDLTLTLYVLAGYLIVWLYDYWANRDLSREILQLFAPGSKKVFWQVDYQTGDPESPEKKNQWILHLHGRSRLKVVPNDGSKSPMPEALLARNFVNVLAANAKKEDKAEAQDLALEVERVEKNHLIGIHVSFASVVLTGILVLSHETPNPLITEVDQVLQLVPDSESTESPQKTSCVNPGYSTPDGASEGAEANQEGHRLACRLYRAGISGPVIMLAASGGGTRASLYTASLLKGLWRLGKLDQIVLASGVSGGGVALTYFAANYEALRNSPENRTVESESLQGCDLSEKTPDEPWGKFCHAMAAPYIHDVIEGVWETRIAKEDTSSVLLAESFWDHWGKYAEKETLGDLTNGPALILNTTLAGHPRDASKRLQQQFCPNSKKKSGSDDVKDKCDDVNEVYASHAGGRLVFTNLKGPVRHYSSPSSTFPSRSVGNATDSFLKYVVINDPDVRLTEAAALTANFPPVFSNAGVKIVSGREAKGIANGTYWVTDGGVADNRGIISLLYALEIALREMVYSGLDIPSIHILVADASADTIDYSAGRGIPVVMGSSAPFASQLMVELFSDIEDTIRKAKADAKKGGEEEIVEDRDRGAVEMHYLAIPRMFIYRGGLGTHWMIPESALFYDPNHEGSNPEEYILDKNEIIALLFAIHNNELRRSKDGSFGCEYLQQSANGELRDVSNLEAPDDGEMQLIKKKWLCKDVHKEVWGKLVGELQRADEEKAASLLR